LGHPFIIAFNIYVLFIKLILVSLIKKTFGGIEFYINNNNLTIELRELMTHKVFFGAINSDEGVKFLFKFLKNNI